MDNKGSQVAVRKSIGSNGIWVERKHRSAGSNDLNAAVRDGRDVRSCCCFDCSPL